jgi:NADH-quinone oxidoreductase subunit M
MPINSPIQMQFGGFPLLSLIIFFPLIGAILLLLLKPVAARLLYWLTVIFAAIEFGLAIALLLTFGGSVTGYRWAEEMAWVPQLGLSYQVASDSISAWLVVLCAFVTLVAVFTAGGIAERPRIFWAWLLGMQFGMMGVFLSSNLLLFYVFWEVMLIPAYFMIGQWGASQDRVKSAVRFVLYTIAGSLLMLAAMLALIFVVPGNNKSLNFQALQAGIAQLSPEVQNWLFLAFAAAFLVKVPLVPFQAWQPDAYADAPTPTVLMLAGVMSKTGAYGFLRFGVLLFPNPAREFAPLICILAIASIIYGAVVALGQRDLKRLLAYSSLSHMGFIVLGIFALNEQGISGAVLQMVNHGIVTPALFLAAAAVSARFGTTDLTAMGGLQEKLPRLAALFLILSLASMGLPGLNQFAGEFLILGGAYAASPWYAGFAVVGVVLAAWYTMRLFQIIWHNKVTSYELRVTKDDQVKIPDMQTGEYVLFVPLVLLIVLFGVAPIIVTGILDGTVQDWLRNTAHFAGR